MRKLGKKIDARETIEAYLPVCYWCTCMCGGDSPKAEGTYLYRAVEKIYN